MLKNKLKKAKFDYIPEQLALGASVEMEHTDNPAVAMKIAMDHLKEDPNYYTHLVKMESKYQKSEYSDGGLSPLMKQKYADGGIGDLTAEEVATLKKQREYLKHDAKYFHEEESFPKVVEKEEVEPVDKDFDYSAYRAEIENRRAERASKYADGGTKGEIIKGQSFAGDKVDARVNSGEMVLNLEQQQRLLDLIRQSQFKDGGVKQVWGMEAYPDRESAIADRDAAKKAAQYWAEKEAAGDAGAAVRKGINAGKVEMIEKLLAKGGKYALPALIGSGALRVVAGPEVAVASEALGADEVGAGSDVTEGEPTYTKQQAVNKQLDESKIPDPYAAAILASTKKPEYANGGRVDEQVDRGAMKINQEQQQLLMKVLRGEISPKELGEGNIVDNKPAYADGGDVMPDATSQLVKANAGLSAPMQYTGPGAEATVQAPLATPPSMQQIPMAAPAAQAPTAPAPATIPAAPITPVVPKAAPVSNVPTAEEMAAARAPYNAQAEGMKRAIKEQTSKIEAMDDLIKKATEGSQEKIDAVKKDSLIQKGEKNQYGLKEGEIDPNRFWHSLETHQKVLTGVAMVLGTLVSLKTGSNPALQYINNAVEKDIEAQKLDRETAIAKKKVAQDDVALKLRGLELRAKNAAEKANISKAIVDWQNMNPDINKQLARAVILGKGQTLPTALQSPEEIKRTDELRKEYEGVANTTGTRKVITSYDQIKDMVNNPSGPGDIGLVYTFMKALDPTSTVREGEYATAKNAGPKSLMLQRWYNKLVDGEMLTPEDREKFLSTATQLAKSSMKQQEQINAQYSKIARAANLDDSQIITVQVPAELSSNKPTSKRDDYINLLMKGGKSKEEATAAADKLLKR